MVERKGGVLCDLLDSVRQVLHLLYITGKAGENSQPNSESDMVDFF
jgi:hypothetical protein